MKKVVRNLLIFLGIFLVSFLFIHVLGFVNGYGDPINSYGFAKAIKMGEIPYLDFNTISTPLYAFYQALFLFIFDDFIMINVSQAILITFSVIILYKLFGKKSFLLLIVVAFFHYKNIVATYNYLSLFMIILLIYLEKEYADKDYLIGFVIGLSILAKQTVGCFMIIPSLLFYFKNREKILKRFRGFLIPCFVFFFYLIFNKTVFQFFDLCLFGLFDFLTKNGVGGGHINLGWLIFTIITFLLALFLLIKNKKDINNYYLISGVLFAIPLFDITHFSFWFTCFLIMLLPYIKKYSKVLITVGIAMSITLMFLDFSFSTLKLDLCITKDLKHFKYNLYRKDFYDANIIVDKFVNTYDDPVVIGYFSMRHSIVNDKKISYFDVLYDGNYGFNGIDKMKKKIDKMHNQIFIVSKIDYNSKDEFSQFSKSLAKYVMDNNTKIDSKYGFDVYYKK